MLKKKIEQLREIINVMIVSEHAATEELLKLSQELDKSIVAAQKINQYGKLLFGTGLNNEFESAVEKLQKIEKLYTAIRVVDPESKRVLDIKKDKLYEKGMPCYHYWKHKRICTNCISVKAFNANKAFYKIDHNKDNVYMIAAIPVVIQERKLIVEILKNITDNLFTEAFNKQDQEKVYSMIDYLNRKATEEEKNIGLINERTKNNEQ